MVTLGLRLKKMFFHGKKTKNHTTKTTQTQSKNIIREFMPEKIQDWNYVFQSRYFIIHIQSLHHFSTCDSTMIQPCLVYHCLLDQIILRAKNTSPDLSSNSLACTITGSIYIYLFVHYRNNPQPKLNYTFPLVNILSYTVLMP